MHSRFKMERLFFESDTKEQGLTARKLV